MRDERNNIHTISELSVAVVLGSCLLENIPIRSTPHRDLELMHSFGDPFRCSVALRISNFRYIGWGHLESLGEEYAERRAGRKFSARILVKGLENAALYIAGVGAVLEELGLASKLLPRILSRCARYDLSSHRDERNQFQGSC